MGAWIVLAAASVMGALAFFTVGFYRWLSLYLPETAAPFAAGGLLLLFALLFGFLALKLRGGEDE